MNYNNKLAFNKTLHSSFLIRTICSLLLNKTPLFVFNLICCISCLVSCSIFVSTLDQYFNIDKEEALSFWKRNRERLSVSICANLLLSIVNKPLFFHFDEMDRKLEALSNDYINEQLIENNERIRELERLVSEMKDIFKEEIEEHQRTIMMQNTLIHDIELKLNTPVDEFTEL